MGWRGCGVVLLVAFGFDFNTMHRDIDGELTWYKSFLLCFG